MKKTMAPANNGRKYNLRRTNFFYIIYLSIKGFII